MTEGDIVQYLQRFGKLTKEFSDVGLHHAVADFQRGTGLKADGVAGPKTQSVMQLPRCGVSDHLPMRSGSARWYKQELTWQIDGYVGDTLTQARQEEITQECCEQWAAHVPVDMRRAKKSETPDLILSNGRGRRYGFDGPGGTLAWCELPPGDNRQLMMRFDLDEHWLAEMRGQGIVYLITLLHELGHFWGHDHYTGSQTAIMKAIYDAAVNRLYPVDIERNQRLYGKRPKPTEDPKDDPSDPTGRSWGWIHFPARAGDFCSIGRP